MNTLASFPPFSATTSEGCGWGGQPGSAIISRGFIFGGTPAKLTTPVMLPAVAESMEIVAGFGAAGAGCSEDGCDLPQPAITPIAKRMIPRRNLHPKPLLISKLSRKPHPP